MGSSSPKVCRQCGYDISGLPEPVCPECGTWTGPLGLFEAEPAHPAARWLKVAALSLMLLVAIGAAAGAIATGLEGILSLPQGGGQTRQVPAWLLSSVLACVAILLMVAVLHEGMLVIHADRSDPMVRRIAKIAGHIAAPAVGCLLGVMCGGVVLKIFASQTWSVVAVAGMTGAVAAITGRMFRRP